MQNLVRGFLVNSTRSKGKAPPPSTYAPAEKKEQPDQSCFDIDKCFEVGFLSVRRATTQLMDALKSERSYQTAASRLDLFTKWDSLIEDMLVQDISTHYPKHKFILEDKINFQTRSAATLTNEPTWLIDPIDGTMNFVHGFPYAAISVGFWLNKRPEFGIVWNPLLDQCFTSRRGLGSYMNVLPLKVSNRTDLCDALLMHELGPDPTLRMQKLENIDKVSSIAHALRSVGSTQLNMCMVAQGFADAYYEFGCHAWDVAAAMLIVQEAGGVVQDPMKKPLDLMSRRVLCASTQKLADQLSSVLTQIYPKPRDDESKTISKDSDKGDISRSDENKGTKKPKKSPGKTQVKTPKRQTRVPKPQERRDDSDHSDPPFPGSTF